MCLQIAAGMSPVRFDIDDKKSTIRSENRSMSEYAIITLFAAFAFAYSLFASRLEKTPVNGALVYVLIGMLCGPHLLGLLDLQIDAEGISLLAEIALAICLFSDASNANLAVVRRDGATPARLLMIGLPLTIVFGFGLGWLFFPELSFFEIALIATMLAPTDAALGKAVVTNPVVPEKVRANLNVESGLNDGICVPIILFFIALSAGTVEASESGAAIVKLTFEVIGIGMATGLALAVSGGLALRTCAARGWITGTWLQFPIIALALLCFALAQWMGGEWFHRCVRGRFSVRSYYEAIQSAPAGSRRRHSRCRCDGYLAYLRYGYSWNSDSRAQLASVGLCNPELDGGSNVASDLVPDR